MYINIFHLSSYIFYFYLVVKILGIILLAEIQKVSVIKKMQIDNFCSLTKKYSNCLSHDKYVLLHVIMTWQQRLKTVVFICYHIIQLILILCTPNVNTCCPFLPFPFLPLPFDGTDVFSFADNDGKESVERHGKLF